MNKNIIKVAFGLSLVAVLLIFLGVNYVPRISALTANKGETSIVTSITRSNYRNEYFQRSIIRTSSNIARSDYRNEHFQRSIIRTSSNIARLDYRNEYFQRSIIRISKYAGSDWVERHPVGSTLSLRYAGSDFIERHPISSDPLLRYTGFTSTESHPTYYYDNSDYFERHP